MGWQRVCAALASLAEVPGTWWSSVAQDSSAVLAWKEDTLVVRWAGNPALWIESLPQDLLVRTAEEFLSLSPPGYRVALQPVGGPEPRILKGLDELARRFASFRRRVMRYPHPQGNIVDRIVRREPCAVAVDMPLPSNAPSVDMVLLLPAGVASCWLVRRAECLRSPQARSLLVQQLASLRHALASSQALATIADAIARWPHVPAVFARRRVRGTLRRVLGEPVVLLTDFLPELRPVVEGWAAELRRQGVLSVCVSQPTHFGPRHWSVNP